MVVLIRAGHLAIGAVMTAATCCLWYSAIFGVVTPCLAPALALLGIQWTIIALNHGHCPLGAVHARYGDHKTMFELVAGKQYAVHGFRNWGIACAAGLILLVVRLLLRH